MLNHIIMTFLALTTGFGVSAGVFAFILVIEVVPRIMITMGIKKCLYAENVVIWGVILGNIATVYMGFLAESYYRVTAALMFSHFLLTLTGLCSGIFVGCISVALAEILHTFPIIFKRLNLSSGLSFLVLSMAFGKLIGALYYFLYGYSIM